MGEDPVDMLSESFIESCEDEEISPFTMLREVCKRDTEVIWSNLLTNFYILMFAMHRVIDTLAADIACYQTRPHLPSSSPSRLRCVKHAKICKTTQSRPFISKRDCTIISKVNLYARCDRLSIHESVLLLICQRHLREVIITLRPISRNDGRQARV